MNFSVINEATFRSISLFIFVTAEETTWEKEEEEGEDTGDSEGPAYPTHGMIKVVFYGFDTSVLRGSFFDTAEKPKFGWLADTLALKVHLHHLYYLKCRLTEYLLKHLLPQCLLVFHALAYLRIFSIKIVNWFFERLLITTTPLPHALAQFDTRADSFSAHGWIDSFLHADVHV